MRKRILSIALCLCMVLTLLPTAALALRGESYSSWEAATAPGVTLTGNTKITIGGTDYIYQGDKTNDGLALMNIEFGYTPLTGNLVWKAGSGYVLYSLAKNGDEYGTAAVTLHDATITSSTAHALALPCAGATSRETAVPTTVTLEGDSILTSNAGCALIHANGAATGGATTGSTTTITSTDDGTLTLKGEINTPGDTTIEGGAAVVLTAPAFNNDGTLNRNIACPITVGKGGTLRIADGLKLTAMKDPDSKISADISVQSGGTLTIGKGSTLEWEGCGIDNLTVADGGTLENNGTILFAGEGKNVVTLDDLKASNLSGVVKIGGDSYIKYGGAVYKLSDTDITTTGLNLDKDNNGTPPTENTAYAAGENGYVLFAPAAGEGESATPNTLTLMNADITFTSAGYIFQLPRANVAIKLVGENTINGSNSQATAFKQSSVDVTTTLSGEPNSILTISGTAHGFDCIGAFTITGNASLTSDEVSMSDDFTVETTGTVSISKVHMTDGEVSANKNLNAIVQIYDAYNTPQRFILRVYGNNTLAEDVEVSPVYPSLNIPENAKLTIPSDKTLKVNTQIDYPSESIVGSPRIDNKGTLENNGVLKLPEIYPTVNGFASMSAAIKAMNLTGTGIVQVYSDANGDILTDTYTNDGIPYRTETLNLSSGDHSSATVDANGYKLEGNADTGYTLTLGDLYINTSASEGIILPTDGEVNIVLSGKTTLNSCGVALVSSKPTTISGSGSLSATGTFCGIQCMSDLTIQSGSITAVGTDDASDDGSTGIVCVKNGSGEGGTLTISGGTVNASGTAAILAETAITLNGAVIKAPADAKIGDYMGDGITLQSILNGNGSPAPSVTIGKIVSGGGSNTTTTTTKNEDGSTTTTTTDKATGTVTETTKNTDGSTTIVETKKDGTATTTDKAADGVTTVTKTDKNGKPTSATVTVPSNVKDPVKVDVPANLGKADGKVSAVVTYPDGKKETVTGKYENGKVSLTVSGSATIEILDDFVPLAAALPFTDVPADAWYYDELLYVYQNGLFAGTSATTFSPKANMTREQMWMVLARMAGEKPADMDAARAWAMAKNISDGSNPKNPVTREQFVTLLWRFAGSPKATKDMSGYTDFDAVADYAKEAMRWAVENGIVAGTSTTTLSPKGNASRAQIAVILARYKQK